MSSLCVSLFPNLASPASHFLTLTHANDSWQCWLPGSWPWAGKQREKKAAYVRTEPEVWDSLPWVLWEAGITMQGGIGWSPLLCHPQVSFEGKDAYWQQMTFWWPVSDGKCWASVLDLKHFSGKWQTRLKTGLKAGPAPGLSAKVLTWVLRVLCICI